MNLNMNATTSACNDLLFANARVTPHRKDKPLADAAPAPSASGSSPASTSAIDPAAQSAPKIQGHFGPDDMQALMQEWGQSNSRYDLNADGTVNVDDLVAMIMHWQTTPPDAPTSDPADILTGPAEIDSTPSLQPAKIEPATTKRPQEPDTTVGASSGAPTTNAENTLGAEPTNGGDPLDGLVGSWGQDGTQYDFDGNGVVDADDLIHMILNWGAPPAATAAPTPVATAQASAIIPPIPSASDIATNQPSDTDKPGRSRAIEGARSDRLAKPRHHDRDRDTGALPPNALAKVTASLVDRLMSAGFTDRPPSNLRDIVNSLKLAPSDTKSVMRSLRQAYPDGLGVNYQA